SLFFFKLRRPTIVPLFPYTTLFRSVVLYEMLTGQPLFASSSLTEAMAKTVAAPPPRVHSVRRDVPRALDELVAQLLVKDPKARPDRKSTRLNSSHVKISYAVFCLKK